MKKENKMSDNVSLGNQILLGKIDELRELGISGMIPLPQVSRTYTHPRHLPLP